MSCDICGTRTDRINKKTGLCMSQVLELVSPNVDVEKRRVAIQLYGDQVKRYLKIQNFLQIQLLNLSRLIALFNDY